MNDNANLKSGFGGMLAVGQRPALLVVDFQRGFTEPALSPLADDCSVAIMATNQLISAIRPHGPVVFTICSFAPDLRDAGLWSRKCPTLATLQRGSPTCEIDHRLKIGKDDLVLEKTQASAFFGTPLAGILAAMRIDTVFVAGCTTSGCIRASVVDALAHGFAPFVVEEACTDRSAQQHASNLIDLRDKYAEVIGLPGALRQIQALQVTHADTPRDGAG